MRALSAIPWVMGLPGSGDQALQPIAGEKLAAVTVAAVEREACANTILQVVGPESLSFRDYLLSFRQWLGIAPPVLLLRIPLFLIGLAALLGQWLGRGPLGLTMYRMLQRGNVGDAGAYAELVERTGVGWISVFLRNPPRVAKQHKAFFDKCLPALLSCHRTGQESGADPGDGSGDAG